MATKAGKLPGAMIAAGFLTVVLTLSPASARAGSLQKIRIAVPVISMSVLPILEGHAEGVFRKEGFKAEVHQMRTALALPAVVQGSVDYTASAETAIRAAVSGLPVKALGFMAIRPIFVLVSRPGIKSVADLKGGKIAVSSLRTTTDFAARDIVRHFGLNPATDIVTLALGSEANKIASVKSGATDAAILSPPDDSIAEEEGLKKLVFASDIIQGLQAGLATSDAKIKDDPAQVRRVALAFVRSLELVRKDRETTVKFIMKKWKVDHRVAEKSYVQVRRNISPNGTAPLKLVRDLVSRVEKRQKMRRKIRASQVVDFSFVRAADRTEGISLARGTR